jgi:hypothetical protein
MTQLPTASHASHMHIANLPKPNPSCFLPSWYGVLCQEPTTICLSDSKQPSHGQLQGPPSTFNPWQNCPIYMLTYSRSSNVRPCSDHPHTTSCKNGSMCCHSRHTVSTQNTAVCHQWRGTPRRLHFTAIYTLKTRHSGSFNCFATK